MEKEEENIKDELGSLSPQLLPKPMNPPPEGYFDGLPVEVIEKWKRNQVRGRLIVIRRWITVAAVTVGIMLVGWWILQNQTAPANPSAMALNSADAYEYVIENIGDFETLIEYVQLPNEGSIMIHDSSAAQEYLLEELQGNDLEQIF